MAYMKKVLHRPPIHDYPASPSRAMNSHDHGERTATKKPLSFFTKMTKFLMCLILHGCRKVLFMPVLFKVVVYFGVLICGSLATDRYPLPQSYFSNKYNVFNQYFVKVGWGWTFGLLSVFIFLTSYTYCCGRMDLVRRHLSRLLVGTFFWYFWTSIFDQVEHVTGTCTSSDFSDKRSCFKGGFIWNGFDISGHAFLLIHCSLTIMEEMRVFQDWDKIATVIKREESKLLRNLKEVEMNDLKLAFDDLRPYITALVVWITCILLLWEVMLVCTTLYFHSIYQKMLGGAIGVLTWYLSYHILFKMKGRLSPGSPGQGLIEYRGLKLKLES